MRTLKVQVLSLYPVLEVQSDGEEGDRSQRNRTDVEPYKTGRSRSESISPLVHALKNAFYISSNTNVLTLGSAALSLASHVLRHLLERLWGLCGRLLRRCGLGLGGRRLALLQLLERRFLLRSANF